MRIYKPKNSSFWAYEFVFDGQRYHRSTKVKNERDARTIANAAHTAVALGAVGITKRQDAPTLREFRDTFITAVQAEKPDKPKTVQFYTYSFDALLQYEPLAKARLDRIDETLVQRFTVWALARKCERDPGRTISIATLNRWRATLRKALRMALRSKIISSVPRIPQLQGERERTFVYSETLRQTYDELAPEPLNTFIQLSCEIGICETEAIDLLKADVHLESTADEWGHYGHLRIVKGKTKFRKRDLPITARAREVLAHWMARSKCDLVFTREDGISPVSRYTLIQQQERMRQLLKLPWDACVHSGRHTALTNLGLTGVDPFTLQRIAGHASIATTSRYIHPTPPAMKDAFKKKAAGEERDRRKARRKQPNKVVSIAPRVQSQAAATGVGE